MTTLVQSPTATGSRAASRPALGWGVHDSQAMIWRCLRRSTREIDVLLMSVALPVIIMLMFVYVFGGSIDTGGAYVNYVVPGIIVLCVGYGSATTAVAVASDLTGGIMNRFRSLPIRRSSVLTGHVVASMARNAVATVTVFAVAYLVGFRPVAGAVEWLGVVALLALYVLAITWIGVLTGLLASSPDAANGLSFAIMFLPYVSSAFVRPESMPRVLEIIARYQPVTPVTDTLRGWLVGEPLGSEPWAALAWGVGMLIAARTTAVVLYRRRARP
jgi:ABC-2 type transport system permease protein